MTRMELKGCGGYGPGPDQVQKDGDQVPGSVGRDGHSDNCRVGKEGRCKSECARTRRRPVAVGVMVVA